ncbi:hypothetical protein ABOM_012042 [Aspergillus bombycis]|uniref:NADH:flavin oxidoreductase/NADH oxidase N-terminal domain-containing protein n=1 Tax=Aspergillus bombycis TaxID=109264 RepID=A0A1F7ZIR3_9EURO|nr:hypothetical protein ABOM_012042 [Aspergillus bombycis]OGM39340.1 hypothetical protein ABOM_012042 [Aspergillus bombycis]
MEVWLGHRLHHPLRSIKEYYQQRAAVPGTLLITEATVISPRHGGYPNVPGIFTDGHVATWKEVTKAVHDKGSYISSSAVGSWSGVEIHGANGYLIDQFIQDIYNKLVQDIGQERTAIRLSPWSRYQDMPMEDPVSQFTGLLTTDIWVSYLMPTRVRAQKGHDVVIAFGRPFTGNPDLAFRVREEIPFAPYGPQAMYAQAAEGYTDYAYSKEFEATTTST